MPLSDSIASSMPVARSIFVPTNPSHPAPIGRTQPTAAIVSHFYAFNRFIIDATDGF